MMVSSIIRKGMNFSIPNIEIMDFKQFCVDGESF